MTSNTSKLRYRLSLFPKHPPSADPLQVSLIISSVFSGASMMDSAQRFTILKNVSLPAFAWQVRLYWISAE
jgi:hypothetical protein